MRKISKAIRNKAQISSGKKAKDKYKIDDIPSSDSAFSFGAFIKRTWETAPQILIGTVAVFMTIAFCVFVSEDKPIYTALIFIFPIFVFFINYLITKNGKGSFMFSCIICLPLLIKSLSLFQENLRSSLKENGCYIATGRVNNKHGSRGSYYFETSYIAGMEIRQKKNIWM